MTTTPTFEIVPAELCLEPAAKHSLEIAFSGFFSRAHDIAAKAAEVTDPKTARALRLEIKSERVAAEKVRKAMKEDSLRMGKAIDGANNIYLALVVPIENGLEGIEKAAERAEAARVEELREERLETLNSMDHHVIAGTLIGVMTESEWQEYLQQAKDLYELRQHRAKREADEAAAEMARQEADREAQRLENIRLKEEADKARAEATAIAEATEIERQKANAEIMRQQAAAKADRERAEADAAEERRKSLEAAAKETAKREKAEAEAKALRNAEAKRIADEKAAEVAKAKAEALAAKKAAAAPDRERLLEFAHTVRSLTAPDVKGEDAKAVRAEIIHEVAKLANWIKTQASEL